MIRKTLMTAATVWLAWGGLAGAPATAQTQAPYEDLPDGGRLDQAGTVYINIKTGDALARMAPYWFRGMQTSDGPVAPGMEGLEKLYQAFLTAGGRELDQTGFSLSRKGEYAIAKTYATFRGDTSWRKALGERPHVFSSLLYAPKGTLFFFSQDMDLKTVVALLREFFVATKNSEGSKQFEDFLNSIKTDTDYSVEALLESYNGEICFFGDVDPENRITPAGSPPDAEGIAMPRLALMIKARSDVLFTALKAEAAKKGTQFEEKTSGPFQIAIDAQPVAGGLLRMTMAYDKNYLILASSPEFMDTIIATKSDYSNLGNDLDFLRVRGKLAVSGNALSYLSPNLPNLAVSAGALVAQKFGLPPSMIQGMMAQAPGGDAFGGYASMRINDDKGFQILRAFQPMDPSDLPALIQGASIGMSFNASMGMTMDATPGQ